MVGKWLAAERLLSSMRRPVPKWLRIARRVALGTVCCGAGAWPVARVYMVQHLYIYIVLRIGGDVACNWRV